MSARLMLAAIDWNNSSRERAMPGSSGESERHCCLLEEAEDFRPRQHLQSQQDQLCGDTDATSLSGAQGQDHFACPALPANVTKVPKPSKAELGGRYRSRFDQ